VLLTACTLELFTLLGEGPVAVSVIKEKLGLHQRSLFDFLDSLVSLGFLYRTGIKETSEYSNTELSQKYLVKGKSEYIGAMLVMADSHTYGPWGHLDEVLKSGKMYNPLCKNEGDDFFEKLYQDKARAREFLEAMAGTNKLNFEALAQKFDFSKYGTMADVGGALAALSCAVAK
jgi:hypothetical protein